MSDAKQTYSLREIRAMNLCTSCAQVNVGGGKWVAGRLPADVVALVPRSLTELGTHLCRGCCDRLVRCLGDAVPSAVALGKTLAAWDAARA